MRAAMSPKPADPQRPRADARAARRAQLLLERRPLTAAQAVRRLVALQAQYSPSPYIALHARLDGFAIADLERALRRGTVVKSTLMRGTLHLVHSAAYPAYAAAWLRQARRMRDGRQPALARAGAGAGRRAARVPARAAHDRRAARVHAAS